MHGNSDFHLRALQPGDMEWIKQRHAAIYQQQYGWGDGFTAMVNDACDDVAANFDPAAELCLIAEMDGQRAGSVALTRGAAGVAKLRILLVEPVARGNGLGRMLIEECLRFARDKGYAKVELWTNSALLEARHLYRKAGFVLVSSAPHHLYGDGLIAEWWELTL